MGGSDLSQDFHTYSGQELEPESMNRFYVDDMLYETRTPATSQQAGVGLQPRLLSDLQRGRQRHVPNPDDSIFPRTMTIDYVRV